MEEIAFSYEENCLMPDEEQCQMLAFGQKPAHLRTHICNRHMMHQAHYPLQCSPIPLACPYQVNWPGRLHLTCRPGITQAMEQPTSFQKKNEVKDIRP